MCFFNGLGFLNGLLPGQFLSHALVALVTLMHTVTTRSFTGCEVFQRSLTSSSEQPLEHRGLRPEKVIMKNQKGY